MTSAPHIQASALEESAAALRVLLVTAPSVDVGRSLAQTLVQERLVACVTVLPGVTSVYRWEGKLEESSEVLLIMKTVGDRMQLLMERIRALHPYAVPEVLALPVHAALPAYAAWVVAESGPAAGT